MVTSKIHAIKQLKTADGVNLKGLQAFLEQLTNSGIEAASSWRRVLQKIYQGSLSG